MSAVAAIRRRLRPARAIVRRALDRLDPARLALRGPDEDAGPVAIACIYRSGNADVVRALLAGLPSGATVRLWSLDDVPRDLAGATTGTGPGTRFQLLNRLVATIPPHARSGALVLCDDDVRFVVGGVAGLVRVGRRLGFDLYQPAHSQVSYASYPSVRKQRLVVARETGWVEQGPVLALSPRAQELVLPLPEDVGMGWGVDIRWARLAGEHGMALGIVDAAVVWHLVPPAGGYDTTTEIARVEEELRRSGASSIAELQRDHRRYGVVASRRAPR